jgi:NAD(P)-dependent dehydrogenase (short-subunit alcohol dehydrogenase family)
VSAAPGRFGDMTNPVIVVVGAGPGLGASVARRYGREGYDVALLSLDADELEQLGTALQTEGVTTGWTALDVTDDDALREAVTRFGQHAGRIDVLHFNPSAFRQQDPLSLSPDDLLADVRLGVGALLVALQAARPFMTSDARVTATGSMAADAPWHEAASLGVQKAGLRNLVRSIDATLAPDGIRAVSVTVNGSLGRGTRFDPDLVADALYAASRQDPEAWLSELPYDGGPETT